MRSYTHTCKYVHFNLHSRAVKPHQRSSLHTYLHTNQPNAMFMLEWYALVCVLECQWVHLYVFLLV